MTHDEIAENLLIPLWLGTPKAYKMKYARTIWQQFEDQIRNAAYTSDASRFLDSFCQRFGSELAAEDVKRTATFLTIADSRTLLRMLRQDATLLVLLVRVANEARKDEWARRREEIEGSGE